MGHGCPCRPGLGQQVIGHLPGHGYSLPTADDAQAAINSHLADR